MPHRAQHVPHVESGSYPVRPGCAVRPLVDGEPSFRRICEAVASARRSVWVTVAFLEPDFEKQSWSVAMPYGTAGVAPKEMPGQQAADDEANAMHPPGEGGGE